ncbi:glycoside hydrolase family 3 N-terminal domain-containing protein [Microbacterium sp. Leaf320]|uniref:glycoside hydrolase family 3 N-terminal domain-containing protein n=1 Tax=Microbacterium sp. Leaf320 TaxID=1736334 RepID=UPI0006FD25CD|nr:glycoside hydrolase family 3 N-terminal domain-containing protein [Microbacterium sp. Leaf320]KQQ64638.1 glycosyl hydrolase family 3 [Microbacterium sp. Leaf320]
MFRRRAWAVGAAAIVGLCALTASSSASAQVTGRAEAPTVAAEAIAEAAGPDERAEMLVGRMTTAQQAASIVMGHIPTTDAAALSAYMAQGLGGFILMGANIPATDGELAALTASLTIDPELPPLIAIDQEGGIVSRLPADDYAASTTLKSLPVADTAAAFSARAALVAKSGITVDFGTVADVTADPSSFIYGRALGTDPKSSADRVAAATAAQEPVVASTLKHFPGHGAAPGDSHHAIPSTVETLDEWRAKDAVPFIAGIDAGASLLMFGHLAYTSVDPAPASLSARWHEIARDELGFDGVLVTDDLGMLQSSGLPEYADPVANAVTAVAVGNDLVLMIAGSTADTASEIVAGITAAVDSGALPAERLADAATRVVALRLQSSAASAEWSLCAECEPAG